MRYRIGVEAALERTGIASMSSSDPTSDPKREPFASSAQSASTPTTRRGRRGKWGALMGMAALAVALVGGLLVHAGVVAANRPASSVATSARWQTYHDPYGLFTLQMPPAWTAQVTTSSMAVETIIFSDPAQGKGSAQIVIAASSLDKQGVCQLSAQVRDNFTGLTLSAMEHTGALSIFYTENASYQIDVTISGILDPVTFGPATPVPTPLPATWLATDKTEVNAMLVSFHPSDPKPLKC